MQARMCSGGSTRYTVIFPPRSAAGSKVDARVPAATAGAWPAVRRAFEDRCEKTADKRLGAVLTFICNWGINCARDIAWTNSQLLWVVRDNRLAKDLFLDSLTETTALAGRLLLAAV